MRHPRWFLLTAALVLQASCLDPPAPIVPDADLRDAVPIDAMVDAAPACEADTIDCDDASGVYVECGPDGEAERVIECPLGCAPVAEKCLDVVASNGLTGYLDQARDDADVVDVEFTGTSTMDTDSGDVMIGANKVDVPTTTANGIRVFMFKDLTISGTLKVNGSLPVALIADGEVSVTGLLDVSADLNVDGPGATVSGSCVGTGEYLVGPTDQSSGGGGGGHATAGRIGGTTMSGVQEGSAGVARVVPALEPLLGGCRGGGVQFTVFPAQPDTGGGGGGGLQITARGTIRITNGGQIDASGGGGNGMRGGAGGGSGGSVLLESPEIVLDGAGSVISTKGGSGGAARESATVGIAADGGTDAMPAPGGVSSYAGGGNGGTETVEPTVGYPGNSSMNSSGGGGGGSVGVTRFNDRDESIAATGGAAIRSHYTVESIGSRQVP